ncbi:hypothetical protein [Sutterella wadsworthensis]|uniref:hypothetical protein n=1 Tax=Sutterella wadsworthensis TaxID=40545 RepID=UPI003AB9A766
MSTGLNLHSIVRGAISSVHPDISATLYRSVGDYGEDDQGDPVQLFAAGVPVKAQLQSLGSDVVQRVEDISMAATLRKMYLFADTKAWSMFRPLSKTGDYIKDETGCLWLVNAVIEDFTRSGWVCLQVQMQTTRKTIWINDGIGEPTPWTI